MSSIRKVSEVAGVSTATVSRALTKPEKVSKETLRKVLDAVDKVQYRPNMMARNFRSVRSYAIVVLVPNLANLFFSRTIQGIEDAAQRNGYSVLIGDTRDSTKREEDYIRLVETRQADGVIQLRPHRAGTPLPEHVIMTNACGCENTPYTSVRIDNVDASKTVVDHLISIGHRRIGVISGLADNPHSIDRLKGYSQSLHEAGLPFDPNLVVEGDFTAGSGLNAASRFTHMNKAERPTAIFCMNDDMAIGALQGLKTAGLRVPEDISITGFDDIEFSKYCDPPLTTISQPAGELGKTAANTLIHLIEGKEIAQQEIILPYEFIIRKSTAHPR